MEVKIEYGTITSKKTGATYPGIYILFTDTYKKFVILNDAELALLKSSNVENIKPSDFPFEK